jgi:hypothetical protein
VNSFEGPSPIRLTRADLTRILTSAEVVRGENTIVAGMVRVLALDGSYFVQEENPEGQVLLRPRPSLDAAMAFVDRRLQSYERMWDG